MTTSQHNNYIRIIPKGDLESGLPQIVYLKYPTPVDLSDRDVDVEFLPYFEDPMHHPIECKPIIDITKKENLKQKLVSTNNDTVNSIFSSCPKGNICTASEMKKDRKTTLNGNGAEYILREGFKFDSFIVYRHSFKGTTSNSLSKILGFYTNPLSADIKDILYEVDIGERYLKFFFRFAGEYKIYFVIRKGDIIHMTFPQSLTVQSKPKAESKPDADGKEKVKRKRTQDIYSEERSESMSRLVFRSEKNLNPEHIDPRELINLQYENGPLLANESSKLRKISHSDKKEGVPINRVIEMEQLTYEDEPEETEDVDDTCDSIPVNNNYINTTNVPEVIDCPQVNYSPTQYYFYMPPNPATTATTTTSWNALEEQPTHTFGEKGCGFLTPLLETNNNDKCIDYTPPLTATYHNKHKIEANNNNITKKN